MRSRSCFYERRATPRGHFSTFALFAWVLIFAVQLAPGAFLVQKWQRQVRESRASHVESDEFSEPVREITWRQLWEGFSLERNVVIAGAGALLLELVAAAVTASKRAKQTNVFGRTLRHPPIRRFWYRSRQISNAYVEIIPAFVAASYLVAFICLRVFYLFYPAAAELLVMQVPESGVSLAMMLRIVNFSLLGYFGVHMLYGLMPATPAPMHQRFLLILAAIVVATSSYSVPGPM